MAQKNFECRLITPEAKVFDQAATAAVLPAWDGSMGILPNRAPIVAKLGAGEMRLDFPDQGDSKGGSRSFYVEGGFIRMAGNTLTILATKAIPAEKMSESTAQAELAEAEARRADPSDQAAVAKVRLERERARHKLRVARGFRNRGGGI
ncbi:MAG: ATP synthase F1 subunit epsilon [Phycisphaeraceae bacterium]|nr:ATP synthase F1 subunit epsilon [Phycisphaeraceae bacterium]